jgi:nicotinate-nucleotide adenylyltransferase
VTTLDGFVGVFGGTFDPIHQAHLAVAEAARDACGLRRVLFIPAAQPPHKLDWGITPAEQRLEMVAAAIADNPAFSVSRMEIDRGGTSYTVDTLERLRTESPDEELALILSAESYVGLPTWRQPERILDLARLIVAPRDGYPDADATFVERRYPGRGERVHVLDGPRLRLSGSEIRARAASGRSIRYLVPDAVAAYISDHGLYTTDRRTHRS